MEDSRRRFRDQLKRNVGFIRRSCELFDHGHQEEGIRIASALRVLLHDTQRSKSLLSHLKVKRIMKLNSSCHPPSPGVIMFEGMGKLRVEVSGHDVSQQAHLRAASPRAGYPGDGGRVVSPPGTPTISYSPECVEGCSANFSLPVLRSSPIKNGKLAHLRDAYPSRKEYAAIIAQLRDRRVEAQDSYLSSS